MFEMFLKGSRKALSERKENGKSDKPGNWKEIILVYLIYSQNKSSVQDILPKLEIIS